MWLPIAHSLVHAMYQWVSVDKAPPPSRYPRIAAGTLVPAHLDGRINRAAWNRLNAVVPPAAMYQPAHASYGARWQQQRIIDQQPTYSDHYYGALVPAVDSDNNDLPTATVLPPLASVPLGTFVSWNLRSETAGAEKALGSLTGGYIPFAANTALATQARDPRNAITGRYSSYADYAEKYEAATQQLIEEGFLLPEYKQDYMDIARGNRGLFD
jgi:hypothetical protein